MLIQLDKLVIINNKQNIPGFFFLTSIFFRKFQTNSFFILNCNFNFTMTVF